MSIIVHSHDGATVQVEAPVGQKLLDALRNAGETVLAPCGGRGTCGRCRVLVRDSEGMGYRLACQTSAHDGMEVMLEDMATMRVALEGTGLAGTASEGPADAGKAEDEPQAGTKAAATKGDLAGASAGSNLAPAVGNGIAHPEGFPLSNSGALGLAVDIGTTTMALYLVDLATRAVLGAGGIVNPQVAFGSDVISRIGAASTPEGLQALCALLRAGMSEAKDALCQRLNLDPARIERMAVVGNTVMEHFACGLSPQGIGTAPFTPLSLFGCNRGLFTEAGGAPCTAYLAPAVAGYVGGDITAGLHVAGMAEREALQLFVDIGTNGEMALGSRERIICCATAAGPAFEGASITLGMPAMAGAICAVELKGAHDKANGSDAPGTEAEARRNGASAGAKGGDARDSVHVTVNDSPAAGFRIATIDDAPAVGLCGSGLLDAMARLVEAGLVDETGYLLDAAEAPSHQAHLLGIEHGQRVCYLDDAHRVYLTQRDVRQVQLAKAAIRAGIDTLLAELQATVGDIDQVALAGGFGMHLNPASAARIGMVPPALAGKAVVLGNAAGIGAQAALFPEGRAAIERVAHACEYVELSTNATFNKLYLTSLNFDERPTATQAL